MPLWNVTEWKSRYEALCRKDLDTTTTGKTTMKVKVSYGNDLLGMNNVEMSLNRIVKDKSIDVKYLARTMPFSDSK